MVPDVNSINTVFFRFMFSVAIMGILALNRVFILKFVNYRLLLLRGLTGGVATYLFYLSIVKLGVGKGTVISYSYPIFATALSAIFLKEKVNIHKWGLIIISFFGFLLLSSRSIVEFGSIGKYEWLALAGSVLSAMSIVLVKKLHDTDNTYAIFFAQAIVGFWIFVGPSNITPAMISTTQFFVLFAIGATAVAAQLIMTEGYKNVSVSTGSAFYMLVPVANLLVGTIFFRETLTITQIIGSTIVIGICLILAFMKKE